jgi:hypothetical protein
MADSCALVLRYVLPKNWAGCVLVALLSASSLLAQSGSSSGEIRGQVTDSSRAILTGSSIKIENMNNGRSFSATTDDSGTYRVLEVQPGTYKVEVAAKGFVTEIRTNVSVTVGQASVIDFMLNVGSADPVTIDVTESPSLVGTERSSQSTNIDEKAIRGLAIDQRDYLTIARLGPAVADSEALADNNDFRVVQAAQSGISFNGNNGRGNSINVDGGEANDSGGGFRPTLSQEAVEEFQVNRSNYSAEFGSASGGVINIISKSGTNLWHGSAFGFFRTSGLDAADPFARILVDGTLERIKPPSNRQQYGATVGGPIRVNGTFIFMAFEGLRRRESNSVSVLTDPSIFDPTPQQEAILSGLPPAQSADLRQKLTAGPTTRELFAVNSGVFPYSGDDYKFSVRLDHRLSLRDQLMFRYNAADLDESNPNSRALIGFSRSINTSRLDHTGNLSWTRFVSSNSVNRLQFQFNYGTFRVSTVEKFGPEINVNGFGFFNRDFLLPSNILWRRYDINDSLTMVRGPHQFKLGGQFLIRDNHVESHAFLSGRFNFGELASGMSVDPALSATKITALQAFNLGIPQAYQQGFGDPNTFSTEPYFAGYFQDRWQLLKTLTLDLGLRYELDDLRDPIRTDTNNIAPRVGLVWDLKGDRKTIIRSGYGIFYAPTSYALPATVNPLGEIDGFRQIAQVLATGQLAGNIYGTLRSQGVVTLPEPTRTITAADLNQFGISIAHDGPRPPLSVLFRSVDDFASSYTQQSTLGIERIIAPNWLVSANYLFVRGARIMRARDENLLAAPVSPTLGIRVWSPAFFKDPLLFQGNVYESTGNSFYHAMTLEVTRRFSSHVSFTGNYTLSKAIDEVLDYNSDFQANDQLNLRAERALSSFDQRHKFVAYAFLEGPRESAGNGTLSRVLSNFSLSPLLRLNSARPFNLLTGTELNMDRHSTTDRPVGAGRNTGIGPGFWTLDLRLTRSIPVGDRGRIEIMGEAFNLFNNLNYKTVNNTVGTNMVGPFRRHGDASLSPSQPFSFTSAFDARRIQLGVRMTF